MNGKMPEEVRQKISEALQKHHKEKKIKKNILKCFKVGISILLLILVIGSISYYFQLRLNEVKKENQLLKRKLETIQFFTEDIILYQKIEDIWFQRGKGIDYEMLKRLTRITYRYVQKYEETLGLTYQLIFAWLELESGKKTKEGWIYQANAISPAGAIGLTQIMPYIGRKQLKKVFGLEGLSYKEVKEFLLKPDYNLICGLELLIEYQREFMSLGFASRTDWKLALSKYFWDRKNLERLLTAWNSKTQKASLSYAITVEEKMRKF
jgi:hypothetical protein